MTNAVTVWWSILCAVALLNFAAWGISLSLLKRRQQEFPAATYRTRHLILWLSAAYVLGCAFRSVLPVIDLPRICLHDTLLSRIVVGRSVATIAELCFAAQFAFLLGEMGRSLGNRTTTVVASGVVPLIGAAELSCWAAVLTGNYLWHAVENSLWTFTAVLVVLGFAMLRSRVDARGKRLVMAIVLGGAIYIAFMLVVDVPMYLTRWQAAVASGYAPIAFTEGLRQILDRCTVVREWSFWREEVPWITLYFTTGAWASIALAHAPPVTPTAR